MITFEYSLNDPIRLQLNNGLTRLKHRIEAIRRAIMQVLTFNQYRQLKPDLSNLSEITRSKSILANHQLYIEALADYQKARYESTLYHNEITNWPEQD